MDRALWESLFDCPIELNRWHDAAVVTYATLWGSDQGRAEAPTSDRLSAKGRPPRFVVRGRHHASQS